MYPRTSSPKPFRGRDAAALLRVEPQGHATQGDRTGEFVHVTDRPADNSGGSRSRLPLPFGGDQRPVGRMEFASFAMLDLPGHRSGPSAYATRLGLVADFHLDTPTGAQFVAGTHF
jgi:hypothetical protein